MQNLVWKVGFSIKNNNNKNYYKSVKKWYQEVKVNTNLGEYIFRFACTTTLTVTLGM